MLTDVFINKKNKYEYLFFIFIFSYIRPHINMSGNFLESKDYFMCKYFDTGREKFILY